MDGWTPPTACSPRVLPPRPVAGRRRGQAFAASAAAEESADALDGLGRACWWLGDVRSAIRHRERAFTLLRQAGRDDEAAIVALDLCVWYLSNLENDAAAGGWLARAARAAERTTDPVVRGWLVLIGAYLSSDTTEQRAGLEEARRLAVQASDDGLHAMALADLGLLLVAGGEVEDGMTLLDEAMATTLGGLRRPTGGGGLVELQHARRVQPGRRPATRDAVVPGGRGVHPDLRLPLPPGPVPGPLRLGPGRRRALGPRGARAPAGTVDVGGRRPPAAGRGEDGSGCPPAQAGSADRGHRAGRGTRHEQSRRRPGRCGGVARRRPTGGGRSPAARPARAARHGRPAGRPARGRPGRGVPGHRRRARRHRDSGRSPGRPGEDRVSPVAGPSWPAAQGSSLPHRATRDSGATGWPRRSAAFERHDLPFEAARTRLDLARTVAANDPQAAAGHAAEALRDLRRLGAAGEAAAAAALLRELGVIPGPEPRDPGVLTRREQDVLALVADGLSNPRDRRAAVPEPQDGGAPREQHPHQAGPPLACRGRRIRRAEPRWFVVRWRVDTHGDLRLSDLLAALSVATDLGMGQPPEKALRSCLLATGLARALASRTRRCRDVYLGALLRHVGCTATASARHACTAATSSCPGSVAQPADFGNRREMLALTLGTGRGAGPRGPCSIARAVVGDMRHGTEILTSVCDAALDARRAARARTRGAGLRRPAVRAVGRQGRPYGLAEDEITLPARISEVATQAVLFLDVDGPDAALADGGRAGRGLVRPVRGGRLRSGTGADLMAPRRRRPVAGCPRGRAGPRSRTSSQADLDRVARCFADDGRPEVDRTRSATRRQVADSRSPPARARAWPSMTSSPCAGRRCCTTWAGWACRAESGTSKARSPAASGSRSGCTRTTPSGSSPAPRSSRRWAGSPGCTTNALTAAATTTGSSAAALPIPARILAAADTFQTATQDRPHRAARTAGAGRRAAGRRGARRAA